MSAGLWIYNWYLTAGSEVLFSSSGWPSNTFFGFDVHTRFDGQGFSGPNARMGLVQPPQTQIASDQLNQVYFHLFRNFGSDNGFFDVLFEFEDAY
jgi:hypothetical protein